MSLFARLAWLAGSRSSLRRGRKARQRFGRRPLGEMLEQRRVLSTNMAPTFGLEGLGTADAPFVLELATAGETAKTISRDFVALANDPSTDPLVILNDDETPNSRIRFQADPDTGLDFPADAAVTSDGLFSWTPDLDDVDGDNRPEADGLHKIRVIAWDRGSMPRASASEFFVQVVSPNNPPELGTINGILVDPPAGDPDPTFAFRAEHGQQLQFTSTATDPDAGDTLTFSLDGGGTDGAFTTTNPPVIDPTTGVLTWTPNATDNPIGDLTFDVVVTDSGTGNLTDSESVTVTVVEANLMPNLSMQVPGKPVTTGDDSATVIGGQTLTVALTAEDLNIDPTQSLSYFVDSASEALGVTVTADPGDDRMATLTWDTTVGNIAASPFDIQITVQDNGGAADDGLGTRPAADFSTLTVTVELGPVPPVIDSITNDNTPLPVDGDPGDEVFRVQVTEDDTLSLSVNASDANDDPFEFGFFIDPNVGDNPAPSLDASDGAFSWTPTTKGTYLFAIAATDTNEPTSSDVVGLEVTVLEAPRMPMLGEIDDVVIGPDFPTQMIALPGSDANADDTLTYQAAFDIGGTPLTPTNPATTPTNGDRTGTFNWSPDAADFSTGNVITVTITLDDNVAATDNAVRTFTVTLDDVAPTVVMGGAPMDNLGSAPAFNSTLAIPITFSEAVQNPTQSSFVLRLANTGQDMQIAFTSVTVDPTDSMTVLLGLSEALGPDDYVLLVTPGAVTDLFGNTFSETLPFSFEIAEPPVI